jgi:hypothetical protein
MNYVWIFLMLVLGTQTVRIRVVSTEPDPPAACDQTAASASEAHVESAIAAATTGQVVCIPPGSVPWVSVDIPTAGVELRGTTTTKDVTCAVGNPTTCTTTEAHGFSTSDSVSIVPDNGSATAGPSKCGASGLDAPCAYGEHTILEVTSPTTFTLDLDVTTASTDGEVFRNDTIITKASDGTVLSLSADGVRVTGMKFVRGSLAVSTEDWRIDHNTIDMTTSTLPDPVVGISVASLTIHPIGLIDHNSLINARVVTQPYSGTSPPGYTGWSDAVDPGDAEMVFIEDTVVRFSLVCASCNATDSSYSARVVLRHSIISGVEACHFHGVQGYRRGHRIFECYENYVISERVEDFISNWLRAGTGVLFNNIIAGTGWNSSNIFLDNQRSYTNYTGSPNSGICNGLNTDWDTNTEGNGYPCRDQIGRGVDTSPSESPPFSTQALDPAYEWDNVTHTGADVDFQVTNGYTTTIASAASATTFTLTANCPLIIVNEALIVAVDGGAEESSQVATVTSTTPCSLVVSPAFSSTPTVGDVVLGASAMHIRENRDYYNDTARPGYTPYTYPYPWP